MAATVNDVWSGRGGSGERRGGAARPSWLLVCGLLPILAGCLNPEFVNSQGGGGLYPLAPGDTPFVLVSIINDTSATLDGRLTIDTGAANPRSILISDFTPGQREDGYVILWPFLRVGLGPLDSPFTPSIDATYESGLTLSVPFGRFPLRAGQDFNKGDTIIFRLTEDSRSPSFIIVSTGLIDGSTQEGPFARADTFETVRLLLLQNALLGLGTP